MQPELNGSLHAPIPLFEKRLQETVGERRYQHWFRGKTRLTLVGDDLTIYAASPYLATWLQTHFRSAVRSAAEQAIGTGVRVEWGVDASLATRAVVTGKTAAPETVAMSPASSIASAPAPASVPASPAEGRPAGAGPMRRVYDLESFVVGAGNAMAVTAARQVIEAAGPRNHSLYLYGNVGTGKTHLLEAIGHALRQQSPHLRIVSLTAEAFVNHYTQAIETRSLPSFRSKFRSVDVLLIDDVDFLDGRSGLQEEFLHTVKKLEEQGKLLILTGDRHPRLLTKTSDELVTRFQAGNVARLEAPDLETRRLIARRHAATMGYPVADEAIEYVAARFLRNIREVEGAMNCLQTWHRMTQRRVTQTAAREVLARLERDCLRVVRLADVEQAVCELFRIAADDLRSDNKARSLVQPRMLAMYLGRRLTGSAYSAIGSYFGGRRHTTAIAAEKKVDTQIAGSESIRIGHELWSMQDLVENLTRRIQAG